MDLAYTLVNSIAMPMIILSSIFLPSISKWLILWLMLEINTFGFIFTMKNKMSNSIQEIMSKFFVIQTFASILMVMAFLFLNKSNNFWMFNIYSINLIISTSMLIKMAAIPFHMWFIMMIFNLSKLNLILFMTWQKIIPMFIIMNFFNSPIMLIIILINNSMSVINQMNSNSIILILSLSSIAHLSWIMFSSYISIKLSFLYLFIYSIISIQIFKLIEEKKMKKNLFHSKMSNSILPILYLMSLAGIPPLIGFFMKWMIIKTSLSTQMNQLIIMFMLLFSVLNFFIYMKINYSSLFKIIKNKISKEMHSWTWFSTQSLIILMILY